MKHWNSSIVEERMSVSQFYPQTVPFKLTKCSKARRRRIGHLMLSKRHTDRALLWRSCDDWKVIASRWSLQERKSRNITTNNYLEQLLNFFEYSDPVAGTLSCVFYRLAMHPQKAKKVHEELSAVHHADRKALQECQYLDAFIKEVLRLHPVVLTGGMRDTPPQGMSIGREYVPGNVTVQVPRFSIARCE